MQETELELHLKMPCTENEEDPGQKCKALLWFSPASSSAVLLLLHNAWGQQLSQLETERKHKKLGADSDFCFSTDITESVLTVLTGQCCPHPAPHSSGGFAMHSRLHTHAPADLMLLLKRKQIFSIQFFYSIFKY